MNTVKINKDECYKIIEMALNVVEVWREKKTDREWSKKGIELSTVVGLLGERGFGKIIKEMGYKDVVKNDYTEVYYSREEMSKLPPNFLHHDTTLINDKTISIKSTNVDYKYCQLQVPKHQFDDRIKVSNYYVLMVIEGNHKSVESLLDSVDKQGYINVRFSSICGYNTLRNKSKLVTKYASPFYAISSKDMYDIKSLKKLLENTK